VIAALGQQLKANYVFPDVAEQLATALAKKEASGGYADANLTGKFLKALSTDLRTLGKDGHFKVAFVPDYKPRADADAPASVEEIAQGQQEAARMGYGIRSIEHLPGNVGYLDLLGFAPSEFSTAALSSAMQQLAGSDALILDLRNNHGGDPASVAWLISHFFAVGDERHLNDIYNRPKNTTRQFWTSQAAPVHFTGPIYVLTSSKTFSGGEECAYDLQTLKRATLVGETTGGGANPGGTFVLDKGFLAFIPTGRAINPITQTNWEHVGVKPDVAVPAAQALKTAQVAILRKLLATSKDPEQQEELKDALQQAEGGTSRQ
jgi:C-terminal processing protease CtpA/Prc